MIKRILVPLDPSPYTKSSIEFAIAMAQRHGSEITGLVILDLPGIEKSIGAIPLGGSYYADHLEKRKKQDGNCHRDQINSKCLDGFAFGLNVIHASLRPCPIFNIFHQFQCKSPRVFLCR